MFPLSGWLVLYPNWVASVLPQLPSLLELSLYGNPCTEGFYPSLEADAPSELGRAGPARLFVGGVRLNGLGKLETRGVENEDTIAAAAGALPDLVAYADEHPAPLQVRTLPLHRRRVRVRRVPVVMPVPAIVGSCACRGLTLVLLSALSTCSDRPLQRSVPPTAPSF